MSPKTKHVLIISVLLALLSGAAYGGLWYAIMLRTTMVHERMNEEASRAEKQRTLATLAKTLALTAPDREALALYVLDDDRVTEFLELIEGAARGQGLMVSTKSVTVVPLAEDPSFEALSLTFEVDGPFSQVNTFLTLLETIPYQVHIGSVSLERTSNADDAMWRGTFGLQVTKKKAL